MLEGAAPSAPKYIWDTTARVPPIKSANNAALGLFDELDDLIDLFARWQFVADRLDALLRVAFGTEKQTERLFDRFYFSAE